MHCCRENRNKSLQACAEAGLSRTLPNLARKPRILVCAPSNAATDELLQRIMNHGFLDFQVGIFSHRNRVELCAQLVQQD